MDYTSKGQGALNTVLGAIGTAGAVGGGNLLGNLLGGGCNSNCSENTHVTRYELGLMNEITAKDSKIALLESNIYTDSKITDTYAVLRGEIKDLACEVRRNKDEQYGINLQQAVYNGTNTATLNCIQNQVNDLMGLTKRVIGNGSVCPGWGDVTITPATTTTAAG